MKLQNIRDSTHCSHFQSQISMGLNSNIGKKFKQLIGQT